MFLIALLAGVVYFALLLYFFVLWGRFIIDLVRTFNRGWRPHGVGLVLVEIVYSLTDPPIKFFRRVIPRLSIGPVAFDFGWSLTMLCCIIALYIASALRGIGA